MSIRQQTRDTRETSLGWMIQKLARRMEGDMVAMLEQVDLSLPQFAVMMTVLEAGPLTQADIGKSHGLPAYTISRALDCLEERGLVARAAHPTSRRAFQIEATAAGQALAKELHRIVQAVNGKLLSGLKVQDRATLIRLMQELIYSAPPYT